MKCVILAGGKGDRLWPLSRESYPKQFIPLQRDHSLFQETVARNLPFCDAFIIVANKEHEHIIRDQMRAFQGITYKCLLEETRKKTAAAVTLAALGLAESEIMLVVPADAIVSDAEKYKDLIIRAMKYARSGYSTLFGTRPDKPDTRYGYVTVNNEQVLSFKEKPTQEEAEEYFLGQGCYVNSGMYVLNAGAYVNELSYVSHDFLDACRYAHRNRITGTDADLYSAAAVEDIPALSVEKLYFEHSDNLKFIYADMGWKDVNLLTDLKHTAVSEYMKRSAVLEDADNVSVIDAAGDKLIVVNGICDANIVNTDDVLYICGERTETDIKNVISANEKLAEYSKHGSVKYRQWGHYRVLTCTEQYEIKEVTVYPGGTIYMHSHELRTESWTVISGRVLVTTDGKEQVYEAGKSFRIERFAKHQLSNISEKKLVLIETDTGSIMKDDTIRMRSRDLAETDLGYKQEPMIRLKPYYKEAIWGGHRLKELYGKQCEYEKLAETWELSAHPAGQSIVDSGRHKGLLLGEYFKRTGTMAANWKSGGRRDFPLIIKFIDANKDLSVQVHPGDEYALEHEDQYGKNEMWYVLEAKSGAGVYCGFNKDTSREEVSYAIEEGTLEELLNFIPVKKGDVLYIPTGTVHAIRSGVVICEVQQSSDCTYRLYDYNRTDAYGRKRELHIEKALDVLNYEKYIQPELRTLPEKETENMTCIASNKYFETYVVNVDKEMILPVKKESFVAVVCTEGSCFIECMDRDGVNNKKNDNSSDNETLTTTTKMSLIAGESLLIVDGHKKYTAKGQGELLLTWI